MKKEWICTKGEMLNMNVAIYAVLVFVNIVIVRLNTASSSRYLIRKQKRYEGGIRGKSLMAAEEKTVYTVG